MLPFAVAVVVNLLNPKFMAVLWTDSTGQTVIGVALLMMCLGILWMRKVIDLHV